MNRKGSDQPTSSSEKHDHTLSIEAYFNCCKICVHETLKDWENGVQTRPDCMPRPLLRSCENRVLSSNNSANTGVSTARPTAPCSTPARDTLSWSMSAWGVSSCNSSKTLQVAKNGHVHRITMHGHLTCPERFWHVSDTRIGTISNPVIWYNNHPLIYKSAGVLKSGLDF